MQNLTIMKPILKHVASLVYHYFIFFRRLAKNVDKSVFDPGHYVREVLSSDMSRIIYFIIPPPCNRV